jgi:sigma-B regulation protein RsbU (phosphoserine phosphatase)
MAVLEDRLQLRLLYELGNAFAARVELDELVGLVLVKCCEVLDAEAASVLLLDAARNELYFPYLADENPEVAARLRSLRFPADRGIAGAVLRTGQALRVDDVASDPRFYTGADRHSGLTTRNILCAPLAVRQGTIGVLQVVNRRGGGAFTDDDLGFLEALAGSVAVAIENARLYAQLKAQVAALERAVHEHAQLEAIRRELDIAWTIQQSILPRTFPPFPERTDFDIYAAMMPAREVGGDFYDFFLVDHDRLGVVIGDVSGKGVPAAIFMAMSRSMLKATALRGLAPGDCLQHVNRLLCLDNSAEMFVTVFYGVLDTRSGEMEYSNGGHNPPVLLRGAGAVEVLERTGGTVLGVLDDAPYAAKRAVLRPGDGIFLYTDGITEAMDRAGALFSDQRLLGVLRQGAAAPPAELVRDVVDAVQRYAAGVEQSDDITALCVRRAAAARPNRR